MKTTDTIAGYDFHCHVDLQRSPAAYIAECEALRIFTLAVTTTPKAWPQNKKLMAGSRYVRPAIGLHPELAGDRYRELDLVKLCMKETSFVGEVGLDGSPEHKGSLEVQRRVYGAILDEAQKLGGKVITTHSRRAANDVIELIKARTKPDRVLNILHWFSGSKNELFAGVAAGCMFSINPGMIKSKNGRELVGAVPIDRVLTETDSPFGKWEGRQARAEDVIGLVSAIAEVRGVEPSIVANALRQNSQRVFAFTR
ncbi:MAG: Qat anti-phage system TatD family nuclease QatD [Devosia marina]|uniref:Qat anti-phage system TatD family nuclease QatD n=1 Tax=Devosia marina TaxID=2683198 RepID=UPI0032EB24D5